MKDERTEHDKIVRYTQGDRNAANWAIGLLIVEMLLISGARSERRQVLEQRVVELEVQVQALRQLAAGPLRSVRLVSDSDSDALRAGRAA